jgi:hypothetical protein
VSLNIETATSEAPPRKPRRRSASDRQRRAEWLAGKAQVRWDETREEAYLEHARREEHRQLVAPTLTIATTTSPRLDFTNARSVELGHWVPPDGPRSRFVVTLPLHSGR